MAFATKSIDAIVLRNNAGLIANGAAGFKRKKAFQGQCSAKSPKHFQARRCSIEQGFEAYVITDACGDVSSEAHDRAVDRMIRLGARPMTSLQYLLELRPDRARTETYDFTTGVAKKWGGAYGLGVIYAKKMLGASEGSH